MADDVGLKPDTSLNPPLVDPEAQRVRRLLRALVRRRELVSVVTKLLKGEAVQFHELQSELSQFTAPPVRHWRRQELTCWALRHVEIDEPARTEATRWLCYLEDGTRDADLGDRLINAFSRTGIGVGGLLAAFILAPIGGADFNLEFDAFFSILLIVLSVYLPICSFRADTEHCRSVRVAAIKTLGRLAHPNALASVCRAALSRNSRVASASSEALWPILRSIRTEHYGLLGSQVVPNLCSLLRPASEQEVFLLLDALEKIGDGRAVEPVEAVAARSLSPELVERANNLLPILRARRARETAQRTLLRASSDPAPAEDGLLRAAGSGSADEGQLLRSADR